MKVLLIDFNPFMAAATPISLGYIGAAAQAAGHEVTVVSLGNDSAFSPATFARYVASTAPDLIGFETYQRNIFHLQGLAHLVKQASPGTQVILGGPQITFIPDQALTALPDVDFLARGEGEMVIAPLLDAMAAGQTAEPVAGVTSRTDGDGFQTGPPLEAPAELDAYPSPWLTGILDPADMDEAIMLTSRGCPHACAFCYTPAASDRRIRAHSIDRVLEEIACVVRRGSGRLWFADPNFSFNQRRVTQILEGIVQSGLAVNMWIETRADMLDKDLLALMQRAGVNMVAMGLESASQNVYPHLKKNLDPDRIRQAVELAFAAGMDVELFSQYALPHERYDDALETLRFVQDAGVRIQGNSNAQQMQIYHGSEIAADPAQFGIKPLRESFQPCMGIGTEFETEWMSKPEIDRIKLAWKAASLDGGKRIVA